MPAKLNPRPKPLLAVLAMPILVVCGLGAFMLTNRLGLRRGSEGPVMLLAFLILAIPAWSCWTKRRTEKWRREAFNLCRNCGYDLHANTSGVCPECGSDIEKRQ